MLRRRRHIEEQWASRSSLYRHLLPGASIRAAPLLARGLAQLREASMATGYHEPSVHTRVRCRTDRNDPCRGPTTALRWSTPVGCHRAAARFKDTGHRAKQSNLGGLFDEHADPRDVGNELMRQTVPCFEVFGLVVGKPNRAVRVLPHQRLEG